MNNKIRSIVLAAILIGFLPITLTFFAFCWLIDELEDHWNRLIQFYKITWSR